MSKEVFAVYELRDNNTLTFYQDGTYRFSNWEDDKRDSQWVIQFSTATVMHDIELIKRDGENLSVGIWHVLGYNAGLSDEHTAIMVDLVAQWDIENSILNDEEDYGAKKD